MKVNRAVTTLAARFDRLTLRERVLTAAAILAVIIALFDSLVLQRLEAHRKQLGQELSGIVAAINGADADGTDGRTTLERATSLVTSLSEASARLRSQSAGLIPPQRMTQVLHDMLSRQQGVTLVSLRSLAPYALSGGTPAEHPTSSTGTDTVVDQTASASVSAADAEGPYVHSVELVLQGPYLDVLAYLQAVEHLPWHFYWQSLQLDASQYPNTRVTVRLGTVSMSRDWIDL